MAERLSRIRRASEHGIEMGDAFREAMSHLAASVVIVMTMLDERPWGTTISACCSVSASPPMLLISLGDRTASAGAVRDQGRFGVSILGEREIEAARAGAAPGQPKFLERYCRDTEIVDGSRRIPVLRGAVAHLDCRVERAVDVADHTVFFGGVEDVVLGIGTPPLIYWGRQYTAVHGGEPWYH